MMTLQDIKERIADIAVMYYDSEKTKFNMKEALDELLDNID